MKCCFKQICKLAKLKISKTQNSKKHFRKYSTVQICFKKNFRKDPKIKFGLKRISEKLKCENF